MTLMLLPHDLIWLNPHACISPEPPDWMENCWDYDKPLVVRRAISSQDIVPVGMRGNLRGQRHACFVMHQDVIRLQSPNEVIGALDTCDWETPIVDAARTLSSHRWNFDWGIGGSLGYSLATGVNVTRPTSDIDIVIRSFSPLSRDHFQEWLKVTENLPVRVDTQIDTGVGGFALKEWLNGSSVLLKTNQGPIIVKDPWQRN